MNHKFDELAKGLAQTGTRRQALEKFSVGLAATLSAGRLAGGLSNKSNNRKTKGKL